MQRRAVSVTGFSRANGLFCFGFGRTAHIATSLAMALLLVGGCTSYQNDLRRYQVVENCNLRTFHVRLAYYGTPIPAPAKRVAYLVPQEMSEARFRQTSRGALHPLVLSGAGDDDLILRAAKLTSGVDERTVRWIVSRTPLVVGIGSLNDTPSISRGIHITARETVALPFNLRLPTEADGSVAIAKLYVESAVGTAPTVIEMNDGATLASTWRSLPWCGRD